MKIIYCILFGLLSLPAAGQIINHTPGAATIILNNDTTIGIGAGGGFKSYLVCGGTILSYAESSSMDTIMLEPGAKISFDSTFSYGYANVYAKSGSTVDMNYRQTGKLTYESGVTILDTNVGPSSFFMGSQQVTTLNYLYTNLPGGVGCAAPSGLQDVALSASNLVSIFNTENVLMFSSETKLGAVDIVIVNMMGQTLISKKISAQKESIDISFFPKGIYSINWRAPGASGKRMFLK